jgi:endo-1,4-beta-xylanase
MKHTRILYIIYFAFFLLACEADKDDVAPENPVEEEVTILKDKATFGIGVAVISSELKGIYGATVADHFDQMTGEYEMKMGTLWTGENKYNWSGADALVNFAKENKMNVHGHTLVWFKSFPGWFKNANYDSAAFESKVKLYVETVVSRYKGNAISWDVANEIFNDNGALRSVDCPVYKTFKDPIAFYGRCFQYARNADPTAKLFYNDYNVVTANPKRYAMKQMVNRFKKEGYPIDGIGDQFHYSVSTDKTVVKNGLNDMAATGLLIHISELDLKANVNKSDAYVFSTSEQKIQADAYQYIVETFESLQQEQKFAITIWGVSDKSSWLKTSWHEKEYPLLFDNDFNKKPAYDGFLKGLKQELRK